MADWRKNLVCDDFSGFNEILTSIPSILIVHVAFLTAHFMP